ncbi:hypothetical protein SDC49_10615 [Lactobacillus sp. R2/2]|nr:hypothetical protein [Lactobacillus sp. R2/2]
MITGMHLVMISAMITIVAQTGHENFIILGSLAASFAVAGMSLGAALRLKDKKKNHLHLVTLLPILLVVLQSQAYTD